MPARLLISHALVVDGSTARARLGSVLVENDRIVEVHLSETGPSGVGPPNEHVETIDARGLAVCPGFVDVHTHSDLSPFGDPLMDAALCQGVTTVIAGNCGSSPWPRAGLDEVATLTGIPAAEVDGDWPGFEDYLAAIDACRPAVNVGALVGHGAIRAEVLGSQRRAPDARELARMRVLVRDAIDAGAFGLSSGLVYIPGMYADTRELVALARELTPSGAPYASHIRGEGAMLFGSVEEAIEIGRRAGVPTHVSHLKLEGAGVWGRGAKLLGLLDRARGDGLDVTGDQYPYAAWESELSSLLPPWAPPDRLEALLREPPARRRLVDAIEHGEERWQSSVEGVGWDRIVVSTHIGERSVLGRSIADIAADRGVGPCDAALGLLGTDRSTGVIGHAMQEDDVRTICARPDVLVASDSTAMTPDGPLGDAPVHPRTYGTFPRVLGTYVRDGVLSLEAAVRKMTALPAARFGLSGRGTIEPGAVADLVLFDPATIADRATFAAPHAFPTGIERVLVAGRTAWSHNGGRGERVGRALHRKA